MSIVPESGDLDCGMLERRLTELEIKSALADDALDQLSQTIFRQQEQLEALAKELVRLRDIWLNPKDADGEPLPEADLKKRTLTNLYNTRGKPEGAWLDALHRTLDAVVTADLLDAKKLAALSATSPPPRRRTSFEASSIEQREFEIALSPLSEKEKTRAAAERHLALQTC